MGICIEFNFATITGQFFTSSKSLMMNNCVVDWFMSSNAFCLIKNKPKSTYLYLYFSPLGYVSYNRGIYVYHLILSYRVAFIGRIVCGIYLEALSLQKKKSQSLCLVPRNLSLRKWFEFLINKSRQTGLVLLLIKPIPPRLLYLRMNDSSL